MLSSKYDVYLNEDSFSQARGKKKNYFMAMLFLFHMELISLASGQMFFTFCDGRSAVFCITNEGQTTVTVIVLIIGSCMDCQQRKIRDM